MNVIVFGGAGYFGNVLCDNLKNKNYNVTVFDKFLYSNPNNMGENIKIINDDICNIENYKHIFENLDIIYYLSSPRPSEISDEYQITNEVENLKKVVDLKKQNCKLFYTSTCDVYKNTNDIINENSETSTETFFTKLKIECENLLLKNEDENIKILRLSSLYGVSKIERNDLLLNQIVKDVIENNEIKIYNSESKITNLHVKDCAIVILDLTNKNFKEKIINVGFNSLNTTNFELINKIEKTLDKQINVTYYKNNNVNLKCIDFSLLKKLLNHNCLNYEKGIFNFYFKNPLIFSLEDWDSILNFYRPNASSKTWYLKEEGNIDIPKMWGPWNVVNTEDNNKMFNESVYRSLVMPEFYDEYVHFTTINENRNKKHIYFINVFDPNFFRRNSQIGFKCISNEYITDIKEGRCKIVINAVMEGYSGMDENNDLEIINKWIENEGLSYDSVHYISANLDIDKRAKEKNLKFNCIPICTFDNWINYFEIKKIDIVNFNPTETKNLFLSYNRNPRYHRIVFVSKLLEKELISYGKISMNKFHEPNFHNLPENHPIRKLNDITPIIIDKSLDFNWANDITLNDYVDTFMSIITESLTFKGTLFLSEKIFKPLAVGHPFMVIGNKGTLSKLKEMGFMTFNRWFDESYDMEDEMEIRCEMVVNEIEKYKNKSIDELKKIREEMHDVCLHNHYHFLKIIEDKYSFNGENINQFKQILLRVKNIYDSIPNGNINFTITKKKSII